MPLTVGVDVLLAAGLWWVLQRRFVLARERAGTPTP